jgi:pSer/pThr/pTyr-binding forkhead associated (FHA) protein
MPHLIILAGHDKGTVYELFGEVTVGRGDDCDLVLDDSSVSRQHVRITVEGSTVHVQDLESSNGVRIGGETVREAHLQLGEEFGIGRYTLVPVADDEKFYKGRFISYFPEHGVVAPSSPQRTTQLGAAQFEEMERNRRLINRARLQLAHDAESFWVPGAHKITFGGKGMVPVEGLFTGGIVAEVAWNGETHVIRRLAKFATVKVNDKSAREAVLSEGDRVTIGKTALCYVIVD